MNNVEEIKKEVQRYTASEFTIKITVGMKLNNT